MNASPGYLASKSLWTTSEFSSAEFRFQRSGLWCPIAKTLTAQTIIFDAASTAGSPTKALSCQQRFLTMPQSSQPTPTLNQLCRVVTHCYNSRQSRCNLPLSNNQALLRQSLHPSRFLTSIETQAMASCNQRKFTTCLSDFPPSCRNARAMGEATQSAMQTLGCLGSCYLPPIPWRRRPVHFDDSRATNQ